MSTLSIDHSSDASVLEALHNLAQVGGELRPTMGKIARALETRVGLTFRNSQSPYGEPWAPISYRIGQPLRDTGQLQRSISSDYGDDFATVGTNTDYAPVHQFGLAASLFIPAHERTITQAFGKPIPPTEVQVRAHTRTVHIQARPFFPIRDGEIDLPSDWQESVLGIINRQIEEATNV